jgi:hypothetical protein
MPSIVAALRSSAGPWPRSDWPFGALLCFGDPAWSIGLVVLVERNFKIAPRIGGLGTESERAVQSALDRPGNPTDRSPQLTARSTRMRMIGRSSRA